MAIINDSELVILLFLRQFKLVFSETKKWFNTFSRIPFFKNAYDCYHLFEAVEEN